MDQHCDGGYGKWASVLMSRQCVYIADEYGNKNDRKEEGEWEGKEEGEGGGRVRVTLIGKALANTRDYERYAVYDRPTSGSTENLMGGVDSVLQ